MQQIDSTSVPAPAATPPARSRRSLIRRFVLVYYVLLALLLLALIPPYISVNRYQRRIALSISQSLGRPVSLDSVSLHLLPLPGFTIQNLVVGEDPAFGNEPIIRANTVNVNLRVLPLWRRKVEISSIRFTEPSVNLVHLADGRWNLQSILIQAARIQTAPTAQKAAGPAPRFPYIEATGARLNLKLDQEKLPVSLTDAEFALWLPDPQEWRLRIEAHPTRTDVDVSDTGIFRLEGTLGRSSTLTRVPLNLDAEWSTLPLGAATHFLFGYDAGIRGDMAINAHIQGTVGESTIQAGLRFNNLRRADFIPRNPIDLELQCHAATSLSFHAFTGVQCSSPAEPSHILIAASFPDVRDLGSSSARLSADHLPVPTVLDWLRVSNPHIPADLIAQGNILTDMQYNSRLDQFTSQWPSNLVASIQLTNLVLQSTSSGLVPTTFGDVVLQANLPPAPDTTPKPIHFRAHPAPPPAPAGIVLTPTAISLGGKDPATLEGLLDETGYTLHLTGIVLLPRLIALGKAVPYIGAGLDVALPTDRAPGPVRVDLTATRPWGSSQTWQDTSPHPAPVRPHRKPR